MRIVQVTESLEIGGAERVVVVLANALARDHQLSVLCTKRIGPLAANLAAGIDVTCLDKAEGNDPRIVGRIRDELRAAQADVVHTHDWGVFTDVAMAARLAGVRTHVHTVHGKYMAYPPGLLPAFKKRLRHWLERRLARRCRIVCVSAALRTHVHEEVGIATADLATIPNGIEVGQAPPARGAHPDPRFISLGRLAAVKNYPLLLDAFARVAAAYPRARLTLVGDGPEGAALQQRVRELGLDRQVHFAGFRSDTDDLLADADAFVLSSISEGIPMSVLEAMRVALPVVATRVGGIPGVVIDGTTGLLADSGNVDQLSAAMLRVAGDAELAARMGRAGFERVRTDFGLDAMAGEYLRLYGAAGRA